MILIFSLLESLQPYKGANCVSNLKMLIKSMNTIVKVISDAEY